MVLVAVNFEDKIVQLVFPDLNVGVDDPTYSVYIVEAYQYLSCNLYIVFGYIMVFYLTSSDAHLLVFVLQVSYQIEERWPHDLQYDARAFAMHPEMVKIVLFLNHKGELTRHLEIHEILIMLIYGTNPLLVFLIMPQNIQNLLFISKYLLFKTVPHYKYSYFS